MHNRTIKIHSYQQESTQWKSVLKSGYILTVRCTVSCNVHNVNLKWCWLDASHRGAWVQASEYVVYTYIIKKKSRSYTIESNVTV